MKPSYLVLPLLVFVLGGVIAALGFWIFAPKDKLKIPQLITNPTSGLTTPGPLEQDSTLGRALSELGANDANLLRALAVIDARVGSVAASCVASPAAPVESSPPPTTNAQP